MSTVPLRRIALLVLAPVLLTACGDDEKPRVDVREAGGGCRTQGTVESSPAPTIEDAVAPYLRGGQTPKIVKRLSGTATVNLVEDDGKVVTGVVTLVRTEDGWAATTVERC